MKKLVKWKTRVPQENQLRHQIVFYNLVQIHLPVFCNSFQGAQNFLDQWHQYQFDAKKLVPEQTRDILHSFYAVPDPTKRKLIINGKPRFILDTNIIMNIEKHKTRIRYSLQIKE